MNRFLEKAEAAAQKSKEHKHKAPWARARALEALAWTALYWAAENESEKEPMPPRLPDRLSEGDQYRTEAPTKVLPPEGPRATPPREGWGAGRRFGNFGGDEIES